MKFIVTSDLHLDTSFSGNGFNPDVGRKLRYSLQQTLLNVVELVKSTNADGLLCGGDLYDHDRFSPETATLLRNAFAEIAPKPVYIAPGNQDFYGPESLYRQVDWSPNVHIFDSAQLSPVTIRDGLTLWGAAVATISPDGTVHREWRPVARFPLHDLELDITGCMSRAEIRWRLKQALANQCGIARVTISGEIPTELDFNIRDLGEVQHSLE